jgi:hypothetical protein
MSEKKNLLATIAEKSAELQEAGMKQVAKAYEAVPLGSKITDLVVETCDQAASGTLNAPMCKAFKDVVKARTK